MAKRAAICAERISTLGSCGGAVLAVLALWVAGCRGLTLPEAPPMDGVVAAYEGPTRALDAQTAEAVARRFEQEVETLRAADPAEVVSELVNSLPPPSTGSADAGPPASEGVAIGETTLTGKGYLQLEHRCPGWPMAGGPGDADAGALTLNVLVRNSALFEVVWGEFRACRSVQVERGMMLEVEASGRFAVHFDGRIGPQTFEPDALTVRFDGEIRLGRDGRPLSLGLDFRIRGMSALDFRVTGALAGEEGPGQEGWVIASFEGDQGTIRATNGDFSCDLTARRCVEPGGREVTW